MGKKADVVLLKNDQSPTWFPIVNPYGHVVLQAGRGDVHTVLVNGRMVKHDHRLLGVDLAACGRGRNRPSITCAPASARRRGSAE